MKDETDNIRQNRRTNLLPDEKDRMILSALSKDASQTNAAIGEQVHLSAPAVHERIKRLRQAGIIKRTTVEIDGTGIGRPLQAFIHVKTRGWGPDGPMLALADNPAVEEIHSVTGDTCLIIKVRCESTQHLEQLLASLYEMEHVIDTQSYITLSTYLDRGPQPELTEID